MANKTANRGHRPAGKYNNSDQAPAWEALAAQITAQLDEHPAPAGIHNGGPHPGSLKALAEAMGLSNSRSTLRHMLRGTRRQDSDGARIPGPDKIKAARAWLKAARKEALRDP